MRLRDGAHDVHDAQVAAQLVAVEVVINGAAAAVVLFKMHVYPVFAGQDALPQTAPGERRGIQQARGFEHGGLVVAVSQAVVILK